MSDNQNDTSSDQKYGLLTETVQLSQFSSAATLSIPIDPQDKCYNLDINDNLSSCLAYLDKSYSQSAWKTTSEFLTYLNERHKYLKIDYATAMIASVETLYGQFGAAQEPKFDHSPHLLHLKNFTRNSENSSFNFEYDTKNFFNLNDILLYSPKSIEGYEKILFIFYQLLKLVKYLHSVNLNCGELKLSDIFINQSYWIRVKLPFQSILSTYEVMDSTTSNKRRTNLNDLILENSDSSSDEENENRNGEKISTYLIKEQLNEIYNSYKHLTHKDLANITKNWCNNKISNFNYLLIINCIAGRKLDCPYNHPIFPWISDFTSLNTNLRDLSVSKFRLNKGDAHLDLIYQASANSATGSYHLTEFLSEITYFVYKSRITSKETLCKNVRRTWVPNEYPISISRLFFWTPEECIPEFYCDTNIFKSIHDDLPDLKVPDWCNGSVEEFVRTHRLLLDSDLVSKKLHNWIDLVFGFKLSGEAAIESKNICLPLIDNHQTMKPHGIVQLFSTPHPNRAIDKTYFSDKPPRIKNKQRNYKDFQGITPEFDNTRRKTIINTKEIINLETPINLPDDYNPLALIDQMETLLRFTNKTYNCFPDLAIKQKANYQTNEDLAQRDLKCITCILSEIILFHKLKCLPQQNTLSIRCAFISKAIVKEPHVITGPFMQLILSVLKPFGDLLANHQNEKQQITINSKKSKSNLPYFLENIAKCQNDYVNVDMLLSKHLTILPFKPYFVTLYKFSEIFMKIEYLTNEFCDLKQNYLHQQLMYLLRKTGSLNNQFYSQQQISHFQDHYMQINRNQTTTKSQRTQTMSTLVSEDEKTSLNKEDNLNDDSRSGIFKLTLNENPVQLNSSFADNNCEESQNSIKIDLLYEQKFYLGLLYIPNLMFDMSDPKKNQLSQSICFTNDLYELILPYVLNLFENPNTCINSLLYLFTKISRFLSQNEMIKKFLPIIIQVLNVVDLKETLRIDLSKEEDKIKFCKLFEFNFINELRIVFGLNVFLTEICPFLIEAISGFKDFDYYENENANNLGAVDSTNASSLNTSHNSNHNFKTQNSSNNEEVLADQSNDSMVKSNQSMKKKTSSMLNARSTVLDQNSGIFDMENMGSNLNQVDELDEDKEENENASTSSKSLNTSRETVNSQAENTENFLTTSPTLTSTNLKTKKQSVNKLNIETANIANKQRLINEANAMSPDMFECDRVSLSSNSNPNQNKQITKVSETAFNTFTKLIGLLGPVLTCKYCCNDLIKMLGICYMNSKCLGLIETTENPINSIRPIEGDRFANLILESLKTVACFYGEQVIVLQYFTHVSNTISACANRLTIRLEASLIAGIVLVNYFMNYLDIKLLMENLNYVLHSIVFPVINLYSNQKLKFPSGFLARQALAFKILDIIIIISVRIGPELTRIELEKLLKAYFGAFNLVRNSIMSNKSNSLTILSKRPSIDMNKNMTKSMSLARGALKARASIFNQRQLSTKSKDNLLVNTSINKNDDDDQNLVDEMDSFDGYLKYSYDQNNELIGSSFKPNSFNANNPEPASLKSYSGVSSSRFRSQSFGLLRLNNDENEVSQSNASKNENSSAEKNENQSMTSASVNTESIESKDKSIENYDEMQLTFTIELCHIAYLSTSRLTSGAYIDSILPNTDLVHRMCLLDEQSLAMKYSSSSQKINLIKHSGSYSQLKSSYKKANEVSNVSVSLMNRHEKIPAYNNAYSSSYGSSFSENVGIIGNQIQIMQENTNLSGLKENNSNLKNEFYLDMPISNNKFVLKFSEANLKEMKSTIDTSRHLSDNWLAYWENTIRINDKSAFFDLKHINLLTLSGHTSAVKCLHVLDNESSIISGSKDKTVKLWSLKNHGASVGNKKNIQNCQWTYSQHKKAINSLIFIESLRVCASCDGSIHVWNPFIGKKITQFDNQVITSMTNLSSPSASFVVTTSDNLVKFIDLRTKSFAYELKTCYSPSGTIKGISAAENLLLVGFSTGLTCLIDMRTGWIQESWKSLDSEILQIKFFTNDRFICTYNDGSISISSIKEKVQLQSMIKVYNEPVPYMTATESQLITATNSNRIGIHSNIDKLSQLNFSMDKLKLDNFKGVISSLNYLPLNRMLLIGSDNGDIKQIC